MVRINQESEREGAERPATAGSTRDADDRQSGVATRALRVRRPYTTRSPIHIVSLSTCHVICFKRKTCARASRLDREPGDISPVVIFTCCTNHNRRGPVALAERCPKNVATSSKAPRRRNRYVLCILIESPGGLDENISYI